MKVILTTIAVMLIAGCSSKFQYEDGKPVAGPDGYHFSVGDVEMNLTSKKQPDGYATEEELERIFRTELKTHLQEKGIYAEGSLSVNVVVDYERRFSFGDSLAKPHFSYDMEIYSEGRKVASRGIGKVTTSFGYFSDAAVNAQVATGAWDNEDEPEDISMMAKSVANDLEKF